MILSLTLNPALDRTIYVERLVLGDTNRILRIETDAGGKGLNVSRILSELHTDTLCQGFLGGDAGSYIEHRLHVEGVRTDFVHIREPTRTNMNVQNAVGEPPTILNERGPAVTAEEIAAMLHRLKATLPNASMLVMGGTLPRGASVDLYCRIIETARNFGVPSTLDADGPCMVKALQSRPFMIKPNCAEAQRLLGIPVRTPEDALVAALRFQAMGIEVPVVSLGVMGAVALRGREAYHALPPEVEVVSTIGCGDSLVAGMLHVLSRGGPLDEALIYGSAAGAATAMTTGAEIGSREAILSLLDGVQVRRMEIPGGPPRV